MNSYYQYEPCIDTNLRSAPICNHCGSTCTREDDVKNTRKIMSSRLIPNHRKKKAFCILILPALLLLTSCARSIAFNSSAIVPAAQGIVTLQTDRNKNFEVRVKVKNLAKPENLRPPKSTYIVWMESADHGTKNLGQLITKTSIFGGALKASLNTTTSFEPYRFFITAEDDAKIVYPRYERVLETNIID